MKKCTATLLLIPLLFATGCTSKTEEKAQEPIVYESVYTHNIAFLSSNGLTAENGSESEVYLLTASVQPSNASDKSCTWSASWTTANGDDVYEYVDLCPLTDSTKCEVTCQKAFSREIKITAKTVEGGFTATTTAIYYVPTRFELDVSEVPSTFKTGRTVEIPYVWIDEREENVQSTYPIFYDVYAYAYGVVDSTNVPKKVLLNNFSENTVSYPIGVQETYSLVAEIGLENFFTIEQDRKNQVIRITSNYSTDRYIVQGFTTLFDFTFRIYGPVNCAVNLSTVCDKIGFGNETDRGY